MKLPLCANVVEGAIPCSGQTLQACAGCLMVQYCGSACQKAHWSYHKPDCKSALLKPSWQPGWIVEDRSPTFVEDDSGDKTAPSSITTSFGKGKYLWGNMPAIDVLRIERNEGRDFGGDLWLLFAASGDARNVVKTVLGLPSKYQGHCRIFINDRDADIVARNAILLLSALCFEPDIAAEIMLHIWYSALVPRRIIDGLRTKVVPLIEEVSIKIRSKPAHVILSKIWKFKSCSLSLALTKPEWDRLLQYFEVPEGLSASEAHRVRRAVTLAPERKDYLDREMCNQPRGWRLSKTDYRKNGILLPFGVSKRDFDIPNPTMYQTKNVWPMNDSADPLHGWPLQEIIDKAGAVKNDLYGALYFYLKELLRSFCEKISKTQVSFNLAQVDAKELPRTLEQFKVPKRAFDRIEVSNIADVCFFGLKTTLPLFGPLLRDAELNPHATLVVLFLNAAMEVMKNGGPLLLKPTDAELATLRRYFPPNFIPSMTSLEGTRFFSSLNFFKDYDKLFGMYMVGYGFSELCRRAGLEMKEVNTVIGKWPERLSRNATRKEFDTMCASGHTGCERYVEFKRLRK